MSELRRLVLDVVLEVELRVAGQSHAPVFDGSDAKVTGNGGALLGSAGSHRGARRASFPLASRTRGFFVSGGRHGDVRPAGDRGEVAARLGGRSAPSTSPNPEPGTSAERKSYVLEMLPYPSGNAAHGARPQLHAGRRRHPLPPPQRLTVLRPMGCDSFGLPAENAAIREGGHPREITERNIATIRAQMQRLGWAIDWDREVSTHEPEYYRWTQWLFLQLLRGGARVPQGGAGQLVPERPDRARERAGDRRPLRALRRSRSSRGTWSSGSSGSRRTPTQLLDDLALTRRGPSASKTIQRNWIGRSEGAEIALPRRRLDVDIAGLHDAPGHAVRRDVLRPRAGAPARRARWRAERREIRDYVAPRRRAAGRGARDEGEGRASSPAVTRSTRSTASAIPIWVADYVLMDYGTGAIMAVPAHDERDHEFAERYDLPIRRS